MELSRRKVIGGLSAAGLLGSVPAADALIPKNFNLKLGAFEITILSDGYMTIPTRHLASNIAEAEVRAAIAAGETVEPATNITFVATGSNLIAIDGGAGSNFMPTLGRLPEHMKAVGIDRNAVTHVVVTHAHPDHIWGLVDEFDDSLLFPNAEYSVPTREWNFWMADDVLQRLPEERQNFAPGARRVLTAIKARVATFDPGREIVPGITLVDTAGHTAGHVSVAIHSAGRNLLVLADALTHPVVSFAHPGWMPAGDHHDPARAVATRMTLLDRLANDRTQVVGYHLPFPGLGYAVRDGLAYRFVAG